MPLDPYNLGPPVYKAEQVLTQQDLLYILSELNTLEDAEVYTAEAHEKFKIVRASLELLLDWLVSGKTKDIIKGE